ncbi:hypothetical protein D3C80_1856940 [compost metagenome]
MIDAIQFGQRRRTQVVYQCDHPVTARQRLLGLHFIAPFALLTIPDADGALVMTMVDQGMEHVVHRRIQGGERAPRNPRFTVNTDAEFHLVFRQHE